MKSDDTKIPAELIHDIEEKKCILFVGAGLSAKVKRSNGKNLPPWKPFLNELFDWAKANDGNFWNGHEDIQQIIAKDNLLLAAQELQESINIAEFSEFLNFVFRDKNVLPTPTHQDIFKIPFRAILTTNYDTLLEGGYTLHHKGQIPLKFIQEDLSTISSPLRKDNFFIFKIHGDIDRPDSIVLGSRSYHKLLFRTPEYLHFLETLFTTHTVLFVGFSGNDIDLDFILDRLSTIYSRTLNKHYILLPQGKFNITEKRRLLIDKRIKVIEYYPDDNHSKVDNFFQELIIKLQNKSSNISEKKKEVSGKSINEKDVNNETFEEKKHRILFLLGKSSSIKFYEMMRLAAKNIGYKTYGKIEIESTNGVEEAIGLIDYFGTILLLLDAELLMYQGVSKIYEELALREAEEKVKLLFISLDSVNDENSLPAFIKRRLIRISDGDPNQEIFEIIINSIR